MHWAVIEAAKSKIFSRIIVTSDYGRHRMGLDGEVGTNDHVEFMMRPKELCTDTTPMMEVVKHVLTSVGGDEQWVWLLQPTSPFRTQADFKNIKKILDEDKCNSVISFKPTRDEMERTYVYKEGKLARQSGNNFKNRQDLPDRYIRSGHFYVAKRGLLADHAGFDIHPRADYFVGGFNPENYTEEERFKAIMVGANIDSKMDLIDARYCITTGLVRP